MWFQLNKKNGRKGSYRCGSGDASPKLEPEFVLSQAVYARMRTHTHTHTHTHACAHRQTEALVPVSAFRGLGIWDQ